MHLRKSVLLASLLLLLIGLLPAAAQDEPVTLVVWDNFTREAEQAVINGLVEEFEANNPNINVIREAYTTDDLGLLLPRELGTDTGPDVAMINQGLSNMGALVEAGLLLPLDQYAEQYDWYSRYGEGLHDRNRVTEDGSQFGSGNLYGVSNTAEVVAVFYHRDIFEELGVEVPTTWEEFESIVQAAQDAGYVPITFGNLEGWPGIHTYGAFAHAYSDLSAIDDFIYRNEGATFATEGNIEGAAQFQNYIDRGWLSPAYAGLDNDTGALGEFVNKESAMWLAGSWNSGSIIEALGEEAVGFFVLPDPNGEGIANTIGGVGLGFGIRATTENPDAAAAYIDFITSSAAADALFGAGYLPAVEVSDDVLVEGTLTADLVNAWNQISAENKVGHYFDWVAPDIAAYIQELAAAQLTPEEFVNAVQEAYEAGQ